MKRIILFVLVLALFGASGTTFLTYESDYSSSGKKYTQWAVASCSLFVQDSVGTISETLVTSSKGLATTSKNWASKHGQRCYVIARKAQYANRTEWFVWDSTGSTIAVRMLSSAYPTGYKLFGYVVLANGQVANDVLITITPLSTTPRRAGNFIITPQGGTIFTDENGYWEYYVPDHTAWRISCNDPYFQTDVITVNGADVNVNEFMAQ